MPHKNKEAKNIWRRKWWSALSKERKAQKRILANTRATDLRRWIDDVKMTRGCVDCGFKGHAAALDFDHVRGEKTILISFAKSKARAITEMEKCEVRCANCHRIKSWERRWGYRQLL